MGNCTSKSINSVLSSSPSSLLIKTRSGDRDLVNCFFTTLFIQGVERAILRGSKRTRVVAIFPRKRTQPTRIERYRAVRTVRVTEARASGKQGGLVFPLTWQTRNSLGQRVKNSWCGTAGSSVSSKRDFVLKNAFRGNRFPRASSRVQLRRIAVVSRCK